MPEPIDPNKPADGANNPPAGGAPAPAAGATFTQADVDRIIGERVAKAKKTAADELAAARAELDAVKTAHDEATGKLTEADKVTRRLTETEKRALAAEKLASESTSELRRTKVNYEVAKRLGKLDFRAPSLASVAQEYAEKRVRVGESGALEIGEGESFAPLDDKSWAEFAGKHFADMVKAASGSGAPHGAGRPVSNGNAPAGAPPSEVFAAGWKGQ